MKRVINFGSLVGFLAVTTFVVFHILVVAIAAVWSISGLLGFGNVEVIILSVIIGIPSLYAAFKVTVLAFAAETDPENN
ncbi:hypothetical protein JF546_08825 [Nitratireductor aquimarinus]|uniref:hypothetical protein n=1 Tax=Nitratireductor TaxID=245876 RepID=UPI000DE07944|nr:MULTISPECIES: hypothetical protein [Nitratireductor]MBN7761811.1 hypothetical protein [Nitratireductor aquibiodomus]MBN7775688.1 hypothetical protein [Nitratireductor pacificus]MBN7781847.1 hypothetical protein [Nitratireductor pacificus]MBN7790653.1 hypothetical protein [Nitratireductor aquimarinus]MBN8243109.1 hypothetical protein [Nitratireductor aquimarinus]